VRPSASAIRSGPLADAAVPAAKFEAAAWAVASGTFE
jgi:hypothetical protein